MRTTQPLFFSMAAGVVALALPTLAVAQDVAPTPAPPPEPVAASAEVGGSAEMAADPAPQGTSEPMAAPMSEPPPMMPPPPPPPPPPAEDEGSDAPASYFRIDHDYLAGLQLWAGATYGINDTVALATDVFIGENWPGLGMDADGNPSLVNGWWGEFDMGPSFTLGPLSIAPEVGIAFDWAAKKAVAINGPQLYTILSLDKIYFESWVWTVLYSAFDKSGPNDYIHTRNWLLYQVTDLIGIGPQLEYTYDLEDKATLGFPVGGHVELGYGTGNSLGLFLGYETKKEVRQAAGDAGAEGRITFVHNF